MDLLVPDSALADLDREFELARARSRASFERAIPGIDEGYGDVVVVLSTRSTRGEPAPLRLTGPIGAEIQPIDQYTWAVLLRDFLISGDGQDVRLEALYDDEEPPLVTAIGVYPKRYLSFSPRELEAIERDASHLDFLVSLELLHDWLMQASRATREKHALRRQFLVVDFLTHAPNISSRDPRIGAARIVSQLEERLGRKMASVVAADIRAALDYLIAHSNKAAKVELVKAITLRTIRNKGGQMSLTDLEREAMLDVGDYVYGAMSLLTNLGAPGDMGVYRSEDLLRFAEGDLGLGVGRKAELYNSEPNGGIFLGWGSFYVHCYELSKLPAFQERMALSPSKHVPWERCAEVGVAAARLFVEVYKPRDKSVISLKSYRWQQKPFKRADYDAFRQAAIDASLGLDGDSTKLRAAIVDAFKCAETPRVRCEL
ncbi:MAG: hypothetical protein AAF726_11095 [Planctomycetota bacterium]